jgi:hypothetical protein
MLFVPINYKKMKHKKKELSISILNILRGSPIEMTASELAERLNVDRSTINSVLYDKNIKLFGKSVGEFTPRWFATTGEPEALEESIVHLVSSELNEQEATFVDEFMRFMDLTSGRACSLCGETSVQLFCSDTCRKRSIDRWIVRQLSTLEFSDSRDFLKFTLGNLTMPFGEVIVQGLEEICTHSLVPGRNFLELWLSHEKNITLTADCVIIAFDRFQKDENPTLQNEELTEVKNQIVISNISRQYRSEVMEGLKEAGYSIRAIDRIQIDEFEKIHKLSSATKNYLDAISARSTRLSHEFAIRNIDQFTFSYLGISEELSEWIGLKNPISAIDLEGFCSRKIDVLSTELRNELYELFVAIEVHPFLPTRQIIENLELGIPELLVSEKVMYRQRLIYVLERTDNSKSKSKTVRLLRILQALDGIVSGKTLDEVSVEMFVSRERVRQILAPVIGHAGVDGLGSLRLKARQDRQRRVILEGIEEIDRQNRLTEFIRFRPGISVAELFERFPENYQSVLEASNRHRALVLGVFPLEEDQEQEVREDMIQALKEASLLAFPVTGNAYDELLEQGLIKGVTRTRIMQVFGSWTAACIRAEVEPGDPWKNVTYVRTYSHSEMLRVVGQFLIADDLRGYSGGANSYGPWRASQELADSLPSEGTIRNQVQSSWKRVRQLALLELRSLWDNENSEN